MSPGPGKRLLSIVVPVYNEEDNVVPLYEAVNTALAPVADRYDHEFVFTDNRSEDTTFARLAELAARDPRVRVFRFSRNYGFQRSILTGYLLARGDAAMQIDCDLQDDPKVFLEFIKQWEKGYKVVYGIRRTRREGFLITMARRMFYRVLDAASNDDLPVDSGDFRLIDRLAINQLKQVSDHHPYLRGTLATLGFDQIGIPYDRSTRERGRSKFNFRSLTGLAIDGLLAHSITPLRIATYLGLIVSVLTFLGFLGFMVGRLAGADWPAGFATQVLLILLGISLNALFLGIIGEYLGRIYQEVRRRPGVIIEDRIDATPLASPSAGMARPEDHPGRAGEGSAQKVQERSKPG